MPTTTEGLFFFLKNLIKAKPLCQQFHILGALLILWSQALDPFVASIFIRHYMVSPQGCLNMTNIFRVDRTGHPPAVALTVPYINP